MYVEPAVTVSSSAFCICWFRMILDVNRMISLNKVNHKISVMV
jgi:hypothetical protein